MRPKDTVNLAGFPRVMQSAALLARRQPGEPVVEVSMECGTVAPFLFSGRSNKLFRFEWSKTRQCHVLSCPASLWNGGVGRELTEQMKLSFPLCFLVLGSPFPVQGPPEPVKPPVVVEDKEQDKDEEVKVDVVQHPDALPVDKDVPPPPRKRARRR